MPSARASQCPRFLPPARRLSTAEADPRGASLAYRRAGRSWIRIDLADRLASHAHKVRSAGGADPVDAELATSVGLDEEALASLMSDVGFTRAGDAWRWRGRRRPGRIAASASHAFAELAKLSEEVRIDRFLFFIRLARSRTLAKASIAEGYVRMDGKRVEKPSDEVRVGSIVALPLRGRVRVLRVLSLPKRRGPASEARACYEELGVDEPRRSDIARRQKEPALMTYVVTDACIKCKYMDCVEVCPVDCFYEGEVMLVINPNECIDCGVCEPECPAEAILPDTESGQEKWLELNASFSADWPNITRKKESPADADEHKGEEGKYDKYFTPDAGSGD